MGDRFKVGVGVGIVVVVGDSSRVRVRVRVGRVRGGDAGAAAEVGEDGVCAVE